MHVLNQIPLYLDEELQGEERRAVEAHVAACAQCRAALNREREWDEAIRQARPLYQPPDRLRTQIEQLLTQDSVSAGDVQPVRQPVMFRSRLWMSLAATVIVGLGVVLIWNVIRQSVGDSIGRTSGPSEFALAAVNTHQRYVRGQLPLEIQSQSPEEISRWFDDKVPFNLKLPNYPELPDRPKPYEPQGARLIGFKQDYAAYVSYRLRQRPISLLVTSETIAQPAGGEEIAWRGIRFHFDAIDGWKVLTWSDKGLTYALVSDFEERGQASCIVCHPGPQDQPMFQGLKPKMSQ
jgi:anti-sigma factor RsiW